MTGAPVADRPWVSIITPCWNPGPLLGDAIRSLQRQGMADWELILVDDGSSDGAGRLAADWALADRRVRALPLAKNVGAARARNIGLAHARGAYVGFLDADDVLADGALGAFADLAAGGAAELLKGGIAVTRAAGDPVPAVAGAAWRAPVAEAARGRILPLSDFTTFLYRKDFLEQCRIRFEEDLRIGEDRMFLARAQLWCADFAATERVVYVYRKQHSATMESVWTDDKRLSVQAMLARMRRLIDMRPRAERLRAAFFLRSFPWQRGLLARSARRLDLAAFEAHAAALRAAAVAGVPVGDEYGRMATIGWGEADHALRAALLAEDAARALHLSCMAAAGQAARDRAAQAAA